MSDLTDEYVAYLQEMNDSNIEVASEFVVMAATLLDIKARKLLPQLEPQEDEEEISEEETEEETSEETGTSEDLSGDSSSEETVQTSQEVPEIRVNMAHVDEVKEIVNKNPRITLWSARSSAVFRYLRKTEPEFSISKEASTLIDEAVSKKYPEIWKLFEEF